MEGATIGDDSAMLYEFERDDGRTRTSDEIGDLQKAGFDATMEDIVDVARDDDECTVRLIGFEGQ